ECQLRRDPDVEARERGLRTGLRGARARGNLLYGSGRLAVELSLSPHSLLALWEDGARLHPVDRALLVLGVLWPDREHQELTSVSVGRRDAMLIEARRRLFGDRIEASTDCPLCREPLELTLSCASLLAGAAPFDEPIVAPHEQLTIDGHRFTVRA